MRTYLYMHQVPMKAKAQSMRVRPERDVNFVQTVKHRIIH